MNAFENIISQYLEEEGYWVRQSVKVDIMKEDKRKIGLPSMPRPEIDLVALNVKKNELLLIEAKSYLDSPGVRYSGVAGEDARDAKRFRLFVDDKYRKIVSKRLGEAFLKKGLINKTTKVNYALAAGNIYSDDEERISDYFSKREWRLFTPGDIKDKIRELSKKGWEDNLVTMTAKLILQKNKIKGTRKQGKI